MTLPVTTDTASHERYYDAAGINPGKRNYASVKYSALSPAGQAISDSQKFEKVATLTEQTSAYDDDRRKIDAAIETYKGVVQFEQAKGLTGRRIANLAIGVPPGQFDAFIETARKIGRSASIEVVKNDKTNEYLKLRAQRATLEKARSDLEALKSTGGSIDERLNVQARLTETERQIQELGVALGDFDSQNELCTVKLTLEEVGLAKPRSLRNRLEDALSWAAWRYAAIGVGFFGLMLGGLLSMLIFRLVRRSVSATMKA